jgi:hypothetical protein
MANESWVTKTTDFSSLAGVHPAKTSEAVIDKAIAVNFFCTFVPFSRVGHGLEVLPALALPRSGLTVDNY